MNLAGSFNDWDLNHPEFRLPAVHARRWAGPVRLSPGRHTFKFAAEGRWDHSWGGWANSLYAGTLQPDGPDLLLHVPVAGPFQVEVDLDQQRYRIEPLQGGPGPTGALAARENLQLRHELGNLDVQQRAEFDGQLPLLSPDGAMFVMAGDDDAPVAVAGTWNDWSASTHVIPPGRGPRFLPVPLSRDRHHEYKFYRNGVWFRDPANPLVVWDGYNHHAVGDFNSVLPPRSGFHDGFPLVWLKRFASVFLQDERDVFVQLPPGYSTQRRYPVMYVNDGNESLTRAQYHHRADQAMREGRCEPLILVYVALPDQNVRNFQYVGGNGWPQYVRFLADELVPFVDRYFSTRADAGSRATLGASLGGACAWYAAFHRPDVFAKGAAQSGSFYVNNMDLLSMAETADPRRLTLYLDSSRRGRYGGGDMARLANHVAAALKERRYRFWHNQTSGDRHDWSYWANRLPAALQYLFPA